MMKDTLQKLKAGDKIRATYISRDEQRVYDVIGKVYAIASYPRSWFIGDEQVVLYHDTDGLLIPNQYLKKVKRL